MKRWEEEGKSTKEETRVEFARVDGLTPALKDIWKSVRKGCDVSEQDGPTRVMLHPSDSPEIFLIEADSLTPTCRFQ